MLVRPAEDSFRKGLEAMSRGEGVKALALFEAAIRLDRRFRSERPQARYLSYYGLCLGLESQRWKEAIDLCREAVGSESYNADLHLNLGRVLVAANRRKEGWQAFQRGLEQDPQHEALRRAVAGMGTRRRPPFPFLDRSHPLNKALGKMTARKAQAEPAGRVAVPRRRSAARS
jgi:tetratricopeptide (TPR) repeat protein